MSEHPMFCLGSALVKKYPLAAATTKTAVEISKRYLSQNPIPQMKFTEQFAIDLRNCEPGSDLHTLMEQVMFLQDMDEDFMPDLAYTRKHAVEIGGGTDAMKGNVQASVSEKNLTDNQGVVGTDKFVVSKNALCQLDEAKQKVVARYDGNHQYPISAIKQPSITNPSGVWLDKPQIDLPNRVDYHVDRGHIRSQFVISEQFVGNAVLQKPKIEVLKISPAAAEFLSINSGETINTKRIEVSDDGCGPEKVRTKAKIGHFGQHSDEVVTTGEITPKLDGTFCRATNLWDSDGNQNLTLKFRNGHVYQGTCLLGDKPGPEFDFGLEIFGTLHFVITYIRVWKGVTFPYSSQQALVLFNRLKRFTFNLVTENGHCTLMGIPFMKGLPNDGLVVTEANKQFFFKSVKTADMTRGMCKQLQEQRICVDMEGMPEDCRVGEFELINGGYRYKRSRPDKLMPNSIDNVLRIMQDTNAGLLIEKCPDYITRCVKLDPEINKITSKIRKVKGTSKQYVNL
jgi:hypothetical protein